MFYLVKSPGWMRFLLKDPLWQVNTGEKKLYLTFDDGPHAEATPFVLDELKKYNAESTFFCIGKNVMAEPRTYERILNEGHSVGNHTFNHVNAWKVKDADYLADVMRAKQVIDSKLFRPPYGRITSFLTEQLSSPAYDLKTVMWSVLSGDFDRSLKPEKCLQQVLLNAKPGSIVVFHDSEKALPRLKYALPGVLRYFADKGWSFEKLL